MKLFKNWFKNKEKFKYYQNIFANLNSSRDEYNDIILYSAAEEEKFKYYQNIFANLNSKEYYVSRDEYNDIILSCMGVGAPPPTPIPDRNFYFPGTDILVIIDEEKTINEHRYKVLDDILKNDQVEI